MPRPMMLTIMADTIPITIDTIPEQLMFGGRRWYLSSPEPLFLRGSMSVMYADWAQDMEMQVVFDE